MPDQTASPQRVAFQLVFGWDNTGEKKQLVIRHHAALFEDRCVWKETPAGPRLGIVESTGNVRWLTDSEMQSIHVVELPKIETL